jgi:hypothetical protein
LSSQHPAAQYINAPGNLQSVLLLGNQLVENPPGNYGSGELLRIFNSWRENYRNTPFHRLISTFDAILFDVVPSMIDKGIFLLLKASNLMRNIPNVEVDQFERFLRLRYQNRGIRPAAVPGLTRSKFFDLDL